MNPILRSVPSPVPHSELQDVHIHTLHIINASLLNVGTRCVGTRCRKYPAVQYHPEIDAMRGRRLLHHRMYCTYVLRYLDRTHRAEPNLTDIMTFCEYIHGPGTPLYVETERLVRMKGDVPLDFGWHHEFAIRGAVPCILASP